MPIVRILVVDENDHSRALVSQVVPAGCRLLRRERNLTLPEQVARDRPGILLLDADSEAGAALDLIRALRRFHRPPHIIVYSSVTDPASIVAAIRAGASDWVVKPANASALERALRRAAAERASGALWTAESAGGPLDQILGTSESIREMKELISAFAPTDDPVLLVGESGTGKELAARTIHGLSNRSAELFVAVNCATIPETLFESEMFGVERGAFTDAVPRVGFFERADRGTLFLDEIGEMPLSSQPKLLRVLEEHQLRRIGCSDPRQVDVRIIAATNCDLKSAVASGRFRRDLYYRINILSISVPTLRARPEDILLLAHHFLRDDPLCDPPPSGDHSVLSEEAIRKLLDHDWPGNVRELRGLIRRARVLARRGPIEERHVQIF
ncbi:sigma 54-interacting transcriptional regulator [Salinispira pacifica]